MADQANPNAVRVVDSSKVWTTLITNTKYLSGLLTLAYSLKNVGSKYPLVALYTDSFPEEGLRALSARNIAAKHIAYVLPSVHKDYSNDTRFYDCWSKLTPFSLVEYERVVQLDSDMLVLKNMDELMELDLDAPSLAGTGDRVFAASPACCCNPLKKPHYPKDWIPENCPLTSQHDDREKAQAEGPSPFAGLGMINGGLQVVNPSAEVYGLIQAKLSEDSSISSYEFADQSLLSDLFRGRYVSLPYIYNALKTLRWKGVHDKIWRDDSVKNVHYILSPKPWDEIGKVASGDGGSTEKVQDETHKWWLDANAGRLADEKMYGIEDGF